MPYHLEKGPTASFFEMAQFQTKAELRQALLDLRQVEPDGTPSIEIADLPSYKDPTLDGQGPYPTHEARRRHMNVHWFGWREVDDQGGQPGQRAEYVPQTPADFDPILNPTTGWWRGYFGDVEAILRQTLIRTIEVALGIPHGDAVPDEANVKRCWPIDVQLSCPSAWFEGWVCWRKTGEGEREGHVVMHLVVPPHLFSATDESIAWMLQNPRDGGVLDSPLSPPQKGGKGYVENPKDSSADRGMWVVTHRDHDLFPVTLNVTDPDGRVIDHTARSSEPFVQGFWPQPSLGFSAGGMPGPGDAKGIICVQPAGADGGVMTFP